jgi:hypothetical protein
MTDRVHRHVLTLVGTATAVIAMAGLSSPAYARTHHPKGEFAPFADCPLSNPATSDCLLAKTEGGEIAIAAESVPITKTITLQGGISEETGEFIGAEDGNTLSKTPQKVPGGLSGLVKCNEISNFLERVTCEVTFENGASGVNATTELAAPAKSIVVNINNLGNAEGTALSLPIKVHLENPLLGSSCYVGSNAHPIVLELTTGTTSPPPPNGPISGNVGEIELGGEGSIATIHNDVLVNNSFSAPGAEGCGGLFAFLIDPIVDSRLGVPSAAGHNTAILKGTLSLASAEVVRESEA